MKKFKLLAIEVIVITGLITTICSCENTGKENDSDSASSAEESNQENNFEVDYDDCIGDYVELQSDVLSLFIKNVKKGSIVIGETTQAEMEKLTGHEAEFTKEYDGLNLTGYYTYENNVLQSVALDCFYQCEAALDLLPVDQSSIAHAINDAIGFEGVKNPDNLSISWNVNGMIIRQTNFSDGYGIYLEKEM